MTPSRTAISRTTTWSSCFLLTAPSSDIPHVCVALLVTITGLPRTSASFCRQWHRPANAPWPSPLHVPSHRRPKNSTNRSFYAPTWRIVSSKMPTASKDNHKIRPSIFPLALLVDDVASDEHVLVTYNRVPPIGAIERSRPPI